MTVTSEIDLDSIAAGQESTGPSHAAPTQPEEFVTPSTRADHRAEDAPVTPGEAMLKRFALPRPKGERPLIMGIVNATPDSFSDGGLYLAAEAAIDRGAELFAEGADLIDVGGESTRPGANRVSVDDELARVIPVVAGLAARGIPVSVDTMNSVTALAAAEAGAVVINDVSGGLNDPEMYRIIARTGLHYIAMHWRGHSDQMQNNTDYTDVATDVRHELAQRVAEMFVWGIDPERIILDPGVGFAKNGEQNWQALASLPQLASLGLPILVGASRKKFLAKFAPEGAAPDERDPATAVVSVLAAEAGAWGVRVHNVEATKAALAVWSAWQKGAAA